MNVEVMIMMTTTAAIITMAATTTLLGHSPAAAAGRTSEHRGDADGAEAAPGERHEKRANWQKRNVGR
jgi:hypothetical protein